MKKKQISKYFKSRTHETTNTDTNANKNVNSNITPIQRASNDNDYYDDKFEFRCIIDFLNFWSRPTGK